MKNLIFLFAAKSSRLFVGKLSLAVILVLLFTVQANAQGYATTAIEISEFSLTPSIIDTTDADQTVTVTLRAKSAAAAGITSVSVGFRSHTALQFRYAFIKSQNLISGDSRDGVYKIEAVIPRYSKAGTWSAFDIMARADKNYRQFHHYDLAERSFATEFQVVCRDEDTATPELGDFRFTPTAADTTGGTQNVTVTVRATDAKSGVRNVSVGFAPAGEDSVYPVEMNRISGNDKDGVYQGVFQASANIRPGTYVAHVFLSDDLFNNTGFGSRELSGRGFPAQLQINRLETPSVSVSGRILNANGQGVSKATAVLKQSSGNVRFAVTNSFGYYRFDNVRAGETYSLEVKHKWFSFVPQVLYVEKELSDLNFTENNLPETKQKN